MLSVLVGLGTLVDGQYHQRGCLVLVTNERY